MGTMAEDLHDQFERTVAMIRFSIREFNARQWRNGITWFQTPARVAYHMVEALDAYFQADEKREEFAYGARFGISWWDMEEKQLPSQEAMLAYLDEVNIKIARAFATFEEDSKLAEPFELYDWSGNTMLGHLVYALRHTMHHQGALSVLATYHGHEGDNWA